MPAFIDNQTVLNDYNTHSVKATATQRMLLSTMGLCAATLADSLLKAYPAAQACIHTASSLLALSQLACVVALDLPAMNNYSDHPPVNIKARVRQTLEKLDIRMVNTGALTLTGAISSALVDDTFSKVGLIAATGYMSITQGRQFLKDTAQLRKMSGTLKEA